MPEVSHSAVFEWLHLSPFLSNCGGISLRTVSLGAPLKLLMQKHPDSNWLGDTHHFSELPLVLFNVFHHSVCYHILFVLTHVSRLFSLPFTTWSSSVQNKQVPSPMKLPIFHLWSRIVVCGVTGTLGNHCAVTLSVKTINLKQAFRLKPPLPDSGKPSQIKLIWKEIYFNWYNAVPYKYSLTNYF